MDEPEPSTYDKLSEKYGYDLSTGSYDHRELDPPEWITDLDREICGLLGHGLIFTPSLIAKNLDRPRSSISRRLNTLEAGNIVEKIERGHYKLTEEGYAKMLQTVNVEEIEEIEESPTPEGGWTMFKILTPEEAKKFEQTDISGEDGEKEA
jgi:predicted transcriptional regulator